MSESNRSAFEAGLLRAKQELKEAVASNPHDWMAHVELIAVADGLNLPKQYAESHLHAATAVHPGTLGAYRAVLDYFRRRGTAFDLLAVGPEAADLPGGPCNRELPALLREAIAEAACCPQTGAFDRAVIESPEFWKALEAQVALAQRSDFRPERAAKFLAVWGARAGHFAEAFEAYRGLAEDWIDHLHLDVVSKRHIDDLLHAQAGGGAKQQLAQIRIALSAARFDEASALIEAAAAAPQISARELQRCRRALDLGKRLHRDGRITLTARDMLDSWTVLDGQWEVIDGKLAGSLTEPYRAAIACPFGFGPAEITSAWEAEGYWEQVRVFGRTQSWTNPVEVTYFPPHDQAAIVRSGKRYANRPFSSSAESFRFRLSPHAERFQLSTGDTLECKVPAEAPGGVAFVGYAPRGAARLWIPLVRIRLMPPVAGDTSPEEVSSNDADVIALPRFGEPLSGADLGRLDRFPALAELDLAFMPIDDADLEPLAKTARLKRLYLDDTQITDRGLAHIGELEGLEELSLILTDVTDSGLQSLSNLPQLRSLALDGTAVTDAGLAALSALKGLQEVGLSNTRVTQEAVDRLRGRRPALAVRFLEPAEPQPDGPVDQMQGARRRASAALAELDVAVDDSGEETARLSLRSARVTDATLEHVALFPNVIEIHLNSTSVTPAGLQSLGRLPNLQNLNLSGNAALTGEGLVHLRGLPNLKQLNLDGLPIENAALAHLASITTLEQLRLHGTDVTDAGLQHLQDLAHLRVLILSGNDVDGSGLEYLGALEELSLSGCPLDDEAISHLGRLTSLRRLRLDDTPITDAGLRHLAGLSQLQVLSLENDNVTDTGLGHLAGLTDLAELDLQGTKATDAGMVHLENMRALWSLDLSETAVTRGGLTNLLKRLALERVYITE